MLAQTIRAPLAVIMLGMLAGGCTPSRPESAFRLPAQPRGVTCDTASASVMTFGRSTAKLYSEIALRNQVSDVRGYMFNSGLRRIKVVQQDNTCVAATSGGVVNGLYECKARAQLCGR
jgi:hypothetical protein